MPVPDPWTGAGPATLKLQLDGDADHVTVRVYTQAMVLVAEARLEGAQAGWVTVTLPPDQAARLRGGAYYYWADADRQGAHCAKVKGVWMVLR